MSESIDPPTPNVCPVCGAALSAAAGGLCPRCLLADAAEPTDVPGAEIGAGAPSEEEVRAAFPQFEIVELIGQGGMGTVWNARQPTLNRHVALKLLPASLAERDPAFAERFAREGQLLARLHHPNIVAVHDSGRTGDFFYIVMEFVEGVNLRQAMRASRFTPQQALAIVPKICDALQYAHDEGVLHRDIKPENILLDAKGRVKLVDFGIAKLVAQPEAEPLGANAPVAVGSSLTLGDATLGTPNYMAPEQIDKPADVDHRADIYSLGVVFYELLTGELPLGKFAPPSEKSAADPRLDGIVRQALEKERDRRQQSVGEMRTQVETISGTSSGRVPVEAVAQPRISRLAIAGACWVALGLLAFIWLKVIEGQSVGQWTSMTGPEKMGFVLTEALFIGGFLCTLGTPILGWIAVSQIRRSAGKLRGLGLAVYEGLLFPLLALDVAIWLIVGNLWRANPPEVSHTAGRWLAEHEFVLPLFALLVCGLVDFFIIRAVWRAVHGPSTNSSTNPPTGPSDDAPHSLRPTLIFHAVLFALVGAIFLVGISRYMSLLISLRTDGFHIAEMPAVTRFVIEFGRIWGLLVVPLMLGVDVGCCFLVRWFWGPRGLRWWTGAVVINLVLIVAMAAAALWLPMRKLFVQITPEPAPSLTFGPVIERVLPFDRSFIDFQSGSVLLPDLGKLSVSGGDWEPWILQTGADAMVEEAPMQPTSIVGGFPRLVSLSSSLPEHRNQRESCVFVSEATDDFDSVQPNDADARLKIVTERDLWWGSASGPGPWWFKTRDGAKGVLQIVGASDHPRGIKIRYRLVQPETARGGTAREGVPAIHSSSQ